MPATEPFSSHRAEVAPSVFLVTLAGAPSPEEFTEFLNGIQDWLANWREQDEKIALVLDPSALTRFDAHMRQAYGEWRRDNKELIAETCSRAAYVAHDKLWRGILTAVFWFAKPAIPVHLAESREASIAWIKDSSLDD